MQKMLEPFQLFDADRCKKIIRLAQLQKLQSGRVGNGEIPRKDTQVRKNSVSFIEFDTETRGIMWDLLLPYIQDHEVKYLEHPYQVSCYQPGEFYNWHQDYTQNTRRRKRIATLTCTLQTAPGAIFETEKGNFDLGVGEAVIIPAELSHRATAPTSGERWSFTVWSCVAKTDAELNEDIIALKV